MRKYGIKKRIDENFFVTLHKTLPIMKKILTILALASGLSALAASSEEVILAQNEAGTAKLTIFYPDQPNGMTVIMCPGGGYEHLATSHEGYDMVDWINGMGITYAVLEYRMPKEQVPYPMMDANAAVAYMRENAEKHQLNPQAIGIMGASAGGNLASYVATHNDDTPSHPNFQVLFYPVISMDPAITHQGTRNNLIGQNPAPGNVAKYSNELQVTPNTPMAFIMHSSDDGAVPPENSIRYFQALLANNVPAELHFYPTGGHGWGYKESFPYRPQWTEALAYWLQNVVLPSVNQQ